MIKKQLARVQKLSGSCFMLISLLLCAISYAQADSAFYFKKMQQTDLARNRLKTADSNKIRAIDQPYAMSVDIAIHKFTAENNKPLVNKTDTMEMPDIEDPNKINILFSKRVIVKGRNNMLLLQTADSIHQLYYAVKAYYINNELVKYSYYRKEKSHKPAELADVDLYFKADECVYFKSRGNEYKNYSLRFCIEALKDAYTMLLRSQGDSTAW